MADPVTTASDSTVEGATPDKSNTTTTQSTATASDSPDTSALEATLHKEREARKALEKELREIRKATDADARKRDEENGAFKSLYERERAAREEREKALESANARWRDSQTNAALATALGSQVADGSTAHVMAALASALSVDDDGSVSVDMTKVGTVRTAKPLDTTKVKDLQTLVSEFLTANPFFAASRAAGGAGGGGTGAAANGQGDLATIFQNWDSLSAEQQAALAKDPKFQARVLGQ